MAADEGHSQYIVGLRIANRRFAPSMLGVVLALIGLSVFIRLGVWQLHRADEKRALIAQYEAGARSTLELTSENARTLPRYQHVHARGHYESTHQILLDNMPSKDGRAGFRVVTPFVLEDGAAVLVDRGWLPLGATRSALPNIDVDESPCAIAGRLAELPRAGIKLAAVAIDPSASWPRVMNFPDQATVARALGRELTPGLVLLDEDQPNGYERAWQQTHVSFGPERHIAYAVQWFALALAVAIVFLIMSLRTEPSNERT
jgi:surfeit locus 1 family protein